jgi:hypothetical protein
LQLGGSLKVTVADAIAEDAGVVVGELLVQLRSMAKKPIRAAVLPPAANRAYGRNRCAK